MHQRAIGGRDEEQREQKPAAVEAPPEQPARPEDRVGIKICEGAESVLKPVRVGVDESAEQDQALGKHVRRGLAPVFDEPVPDGPVLDVEVHCARAPGGGGGIKGKRNRAAVNRWVAWSEEGWRYSCRRGGIV